MVIVPHKENKLLLARAEEFVFSAPPIDPHHLVSEMNQLMIDNNGIGLAAPQVGLPYRMFIIYNSENPLAFFNPTIVNSSNDVIVLEEGCLSYPGLVCRVKRPASIRIRYQDASGETKTERYTGLTSRAIQHEFDHLNGIVFYDRANRYHKEQAFKKWRKRIGSAG